MRKSSIFFGKLLLAALPCATLVLPPSPPPARAEEGAKPQEPQLPELVLFDTIWKDFNLKDHMKAEILQHVQEWTAKAGSFRLVGRSERDRRIMDKRIFVMGVPDLAKARDIASQAGWSYLLHPTFQGIPGKGVKITFVFADLARGKEGEIIKEKTVANHLKALRDTARALAHDAAKAGAAAAAGRPPADPPR